MKAAALITRLRWPVVSANTAALAVTLVACALACLGLALHAPGHVSMDSSVQLYEAFTGQSISFNPPFMSALLRWLGGGSVATALLVLINTGMLYGSFALVAVLLAHWRTQLGLGPLPVWRALLAVLVVLNPLVFLYAGIVWKDVLLASLLTAGSALAVAACFGPWPRRVLCVVVALVLLSAALITRQQGVFMAPMIVLALIVALWPAQRRHGLYLSIAIIAVFAVTVNVLQRQVDIAIKPPMADATSVGLRSLMTFDMAGIVSHSKRPAEEYALATSAEQLSAIRAVYTPERVDTLSHTPFIQTWTGQLSTPQLQSAWWAMLKQDPQAYLAHRFASFAKLMGLAGIDGTLPIHIGVEGNTAYLEQVGMQPGRTQRTQLIYDLARSFFDTPLYRHTFWLAMLGVVVVGGAFAGLPRRLALVAALIATATLMMYASYLPTAIAADFRYLFAAIPLVMLLALLLLFGANRLHVTP